MRMPVPQLDSFGEVVRWVIREMGALCPSPARLAAYRSDPEAEQYHDVRYHVDEVGCPLCRAELEQRTDKF